MKTALVFGGGGSKGSYQIGCMKAIIELGIQYDIVTGTSIGALNGCLVAQNQVERLIELWDKVEVSNVIAGDYPKDFAIETMAKSPSALMNFFKQFKGASFDDSPLLDLIKEYYDAQALASSKIDFGLVTVQWPSLKPAFITKKEMLENGCDYLAASSSAYPIFPIYEFSQGKFIDGGYYDNLPFDLALQLGAEKFILLDLADSPTHPYLEEYPNVTYIRPRVSIGTMLNFDSKQMKTNQILGYFDTLKAFGKYSGYKYTFKPYQNDSLFEQYYFEVLKIESSLNITNRQNNGYTVVSKLQNYCNRKALTMADIFFLSLDNLLDLLDYDYTMVYDFDELSNKIITYFNIAIQEPHDPKMLEFGEIIMKRITKIDKLSSLELMISMLKHPKYYGKHKLKYVQSDPMTAALAQLVIILENHVTNVIKE